MITTAYISFFSLLSSAVCALQNSAADLQRQQAEDRSSKDEVKALGSEFRTLNGKFALYPPHSVLVEMLDRKTDKSENDRGLRYVCIRIRICSHLYLHVHVSMSIAIAALGASTNHTKLNLINYHPSPIIFTDFIFICLLNT